MSENHDRYMECEFCNQLVLVKADETIGYAFQLRHTCAAILPND